MFPNNHETTKYRTSYPTSVSSSRPWTSLRPITRACQTTPVRPSLGTYAATSDTSTTYTYKRSDFNKPNLYRPNLPRSNYNRLKINGLSSTALKRDKGTQTNIILPPDSEDILLHREGPTKLQKFFPAVQTDEKVVYASVQLTDVTEQDTKEHERPSDFNPEPDVS